MSTSRRQLRRRKVQGSIQESYCEYEIQGTEKESTGTGSQSDALSSDGAAQNKRQKSKRRMIRRTEDFQNFDTSNHYMDDGSKVAVKKIKKAKKTGFLPQICNITEEYDILQKKIKRKRRHKQTTIEQVSPKNTSCNTLKTDTDTSVPSEGDVIEHDLQDETKVKRNHPRKRNRRRKVQFDTVTYCNQNSSTDHCESDVKSSDLSGSKERYSNVTSKSASDSDSVVYTFRNKKVVSVGNMQNSISSPKAISDKSDDSVEYNFKNKKGRKAKQSPECKEDNSLITNSGKQERRKRKGYSEIASTVDTNNVIKQGQPKCVMDIETTELNGKITTPLAKRQKGRRVTISHTVDGLQAKRSRRSIKKPLTPGNKETSENSAPQMLKRKSVQFHGVKISDTLDNENSEKRRDTYELNKSITDISVLKSFVVQNSERSSDKSLGRRATDTNKQHEYVDLQTSTRPNVTNKMTESLKKRRTFELEQSITDLRLLKSASGDNTPQNDSEDRLEKSRPLSNTPFSKVTRRKKVDAPVELIDNVSPPEDIALPSTTDESSEEDRQNISGTHTAESILEFKNKNFTGGLNRTLLTKKSSSLSQSDQNISSFGVSSTPLPKREGTYTLLKEKPDGKNPQSMQKQDIIFQKNKSSAKKPSSRIKMPNFSLIHKKAFEKMEDIEHLQHRKAERAKLLLSGAKPALGSKLQSPKNKNILKPLNFGTDPIKPSNAFESPKPLRNEFLQKAVVDSPKLLRLNQQSPKVTVKPLLQKALVDSPKVLRLNLQNPKVIVKPTIRETNLKPGVKAIAKPIVQAKDRKHNAPPLLPNGFTRYGFKTNLNTNKIATKQEQIKAVANKNNVIKNDVAGRRNVIQGVRSNRRFELLMKMRNKT